MNVQLWLWLWLAAVLIALQAIGRLITLLVYEEQGTSGRLADVILIVLCAYALRGLFMVLL